MKHPAFIEMTLTGLDNETQTYRFIGEYNLDFKLQEFEFTVNVSRKNKKSNKFEEEGTVSKRISVTEVCTDSNENETLAYIVQAVVASVHRSFLE